MCVIFCCTNKIYEKFSHFLHIFFYRKLFFKFHFTSHLKFTDTVFFVDNLQENENADEMILFCLRMDSNVVAGALKLMVHSH